MLFSRVGLRFVLGDKRYSVLQVNRKMGEVFRCKNAFGVIQKLILLNGIIAKKYKNPFIIGV